MTLPEAPSGGVSGAPIAPSGGWSIDLVEAGRACHPGSWIGPNQPMWHWSPINVLVLRRPGVTVLVDAGPGFAAIWWPYDGYESQTELALDGVGVAPADVDLLVLTHLDDDHAAGALAGDWPHDIQLAYPRARVIVHADAVAAARIADPDERYNVGTRLVALLERESRLMTVGDGAEVAAGVVVREAPGHRAGHMIVEIDDPDQFVYAADTFHDLAHVARPEWDSWSDDNPEAALATRRAILRRLSESGARTAIAHARGPYAFRIVRDDKDGLAVEHVRPC